MPRTRPALEERKKLMSTKTLPTITYCIIDKKEIPEERAAKKSNTCSKECKTILEKIRRARTDARRCRHCAKPSTPEERKAFHAWRKTHPEYKAPVIGRPRTKNV
jgi:hypothetical protein